MQRRIDPISRNRRAARADEDQVDTENAQSSKGFEARAGYRAKATAARAPPRISGAGGHRVLPEDGRSPGRSGSRSSRATARRGRAACSSRPTAKSCSAPRRGAGRVRCGSTTPPSARATAASVTSARRWWSRISARATASASPAPACPAPCSSSAAPSRSGAPRCGSILSIAARRPSAPSTA